MRPPLVSCGASGQLWAFFWESVARCGLAGNAAALASKDDLRRSLRFILMVNVSRRFGSKFSFNANWPTRCNSAVELYNAKCAISIRRVGGTEVWVVEQVEELRTELKR